ncbi:MAG: hypothetical protein PVTTEEND_000815, partial [Candidatus Fervidibacter sp.]
LTVARIGVFERLRFLAHRIGGDRVVVGEGHHLADGKSPLRALRHRHKLLASPSGLDVPPQPCA